MNSKKKFNHPSVTADVVVLNIHAARFRQDGAFINMVLIKRSDKTEAYPGCYALPGGFLEADECLEDCAARELYEETGIKAKLLISSGIFSSPSRDPRGQTISASFITVVPSGDFAPLKMKAGDDACDVKLFNLSKSYIDKQNQKVHFEAFCVENGDAISFDAVFSRGKFGKIETHVSYGSKMRLAFDHAEIIARALWQKSMIFEDTSKYSPSQVAHVEATKEQKIVTELSKHLKG